MSESVKNDQASGKPNSAHIAHATLTLSTCSWCVVNTRVKKKNEQREKGGNTSDSSAIKGKQALLFLEKGQEESKRLQGSFF